MTKDEGKKIYDAIPIFVRTINNKKLTEEQIVKLTKKINDEHYKQKKNIHSCA